MAATFRSRDEFREVMDRIFALMNEDPEMGPKLRDADVPAALRVPRRRPGRQHPRGARPGEDGNLHWEWTDDVDWEPKVRMTMSSETANKYFQGKENVAMAIARRRIKTGGDVKAALELIPITKPVYARYRGMLEDEYPHLVVLVLDAWQPWTLTTIVTRAPPSRAPNRGTRPEVGGSPPARCRRHDERRRPTSAGRTPARGGAHSERGPAAAIRPARERRAAAHRGRPPHRRHARDTLRRWVDRRASCPTTRRATGRRPRSPTRASSPACASAATRSREIRAGDRAAASSPSATSRTCSRRAATALHARGGRARDRARAGADRAHLHDDRASRQAARAALRRRPAAAALRRRGARGRLPARRVPAARARLRPGDRADRRRRGAALPPLRPRAADARRRRRAGDGRGDGGPRRASCCRWPRRSWTTSTSASCSTSSSRTSSATWRPTSTTSALDLGRLRVAIAFADLAGYTRLTEEEGEEEAVERGRALRRGGRADAARRRARHQDDRRRGHGRRLATRPR